MARAELEAKILNQDPIEDLQPTHSLLNLPPRQGQYFKFPFVSNNETFVFTILNVQSQSLNYQIRFSIYKWDSVSKRLVQSTNFVYSPLATANAIVTLSEAGEYYLDITPNQRINQLDLTVTAQGFRNNKILQPEIFTGREFDGYLKTFPRIIEKECNLPLRYKMLEGELPEGLHVSEAGRIRGVICSIDDMLSAPKDSPAFNWFFENHDGVTQPIGLVFRFKMRVWILGTDSNDPDFYDERWFCIRIYNNWSFDKIRFMDNLKKQLIEIPCKENIKTEITLNDNEFCSPCELQENAQPPSFSPIDFEGCTPCNVIPVPVEPPVKPKREFPRLSECVACQDPTKDRIIETIILTERNYHSPNDVFKFYSENINKQPPINSLDLARLASSQLFQELMEYLTADDVDNHKSLIEMNIAKGAIIKLTKFEDVTPLDNEATKLRNIGNMKKTYLETAAIISKGTELQALLFEY